MKRVALILLLGILACENSTSPDRIANTARPSGARLDVSTVFLQAELFSDEFCKGGNVWWSARFNIIGSGPLPPKCEIRVYTIDANGKRSFFGVAKRGVPELEGTIYEFYADGIAPPDFVPDLHDAGYPPNYGFVPFGFDVYVGPHHELLGTATKYSDITLTSNLFPHTCQGSHGGLPGSF